MTVVFFRTKKYVNHEGNNVERAQYLLKEYGNSSLDYFKIMDDKHELTLPKSMLVK